MVKNSHGFHLAALHEQMGGNLVLILKPAAAKAIEKALRRVPITAKERATVEDLIPTIDGALHPTTEKQDSKAAAPALLQEALQIIARLVLTTELNLDNLEANTDTVLEDTASFQHRAALSGFLTKK